MPASKKPYQERRFFNRRETRTVLPPERTVQVHGGGAQLREFYEAIDVDYERLAFLGFAATGLRRSELLEVRIPQIDRTNRAIVPGRRSSMKRSFISFYNSEFEELLDPWLKRRSGRRSDRLFSVCGSSKSVIFMIARKKTGLHITPKALRLWFSNEMARSGMPDRFIDAFQGRIPRSVLARHCTDCSLETLKAIYDKAGIRVLS